MRVVLDTNVIISAFLWQKSLKPIYSAVRQGKITPCFNQATWQELQRALLYKKLAEQLAKVNIKPEDITKLLVSRSRFSISRSKTTVIKDDPSDNYFIDCVLSSRASLVVSGDRHLLQLKKFRGVEVVSPKDFLAILKNA